MQDLILFQEASSFFVQIKLGAWLFFIEAPV
jgi:hypothetical protein